MILMAFVLTFVIISYLLKTITSPLNKVITVFGEIAKGKFGNIQGGKLEAQTLLQARRQLGLSLQPVQTVVEKRATFACLPGVERPGTAVAPGLMACGDYIAGPYPATLEAAVRSGIAAIP